MTSNTKRNLILIGIAVAVGFALLRWRTPSDFRIGNSATEEHIDSAQPSPVATSIPVNTDSTNPSTSRRQENIAQTTRPPRTKSDGEDSREALGNAPNFGVRDQLEAEAQLMGPTVTRPDGTQTGSVDVKAIGAIMKGEGFDRYMDALAKQASQEPLAMDLTELYSIRAKDAAQSAPGVGVQRVICGMKMCLASVTSPSREAFAPWMVSFMANPSAQPSTFARYDSQQPDGTFEFRITFTTDQSIKAASHRVGK